MGTVCHWQPFCSTKSVRFIGQCWYFNPQWTPVQAVNKASSVWTLLVSWDKMRSYYVLTYKSQFIEGFRMWRGYILAPQRKSELQGSGIAASHWIVLDRIIFQLQRVDEYVTPIVLFGFFVNSAVVWPVNALSSSPSMMNTLSLLLLCFHSTKECVDMF